MPDWSGLTTSELRALDNYNRCPLCGKRYIPHNTLRRRVLDHRHSDGLVRGWMCSGCNQRLEEDVEWYRRALTYLTDPPATHALGGPYYIPGSLGRYRQDNPDD